MLDVIGGKPEIVDIDPTVDDWLFTTASCFPA